MEQDFLKSRSLTPLKSTLPGCLTRTTASLGRSMQNGFAVSFFGRIRDDCLEVVPLSETAG